jgi:hypothetical protein
MMEGDVEAKRDRDLEDGVERALGRIDPNEIAASVSRFARENPHVALVAAAGLGFLLGGGLTPRLLGALSAVATRGYLRGTITKALQDALTEQVQGRPG